MAGSIPNQLNFGSFVPTTSVWEIQQIQSSNIDPNLKEILVRIYQNMNNIANVVNGKESGIYDTEEFLTSKSYFPLTSQSQSGSMTALTRPVFRKAFKFGPLPNAGSLSIPHNIAINTGYIPVGIIAWATNSTSSSMIPLPFSSPTLNENIKLEVTTTNITITTAIDYSSYNTTTIVLEYIKPS